MNEAEKYLERFVGELVEIAETGDIIYLGKDFPDEYSGSKYTRKMKGGRVKAKANIPVMPLTAGITTRHGLPCRYMIMM